MIKEKKIKQNKQKKIFELFIHFYLMNEFYAFIFKIQFSFLFVDVTLYYVHCDIFYRNVEVQINSLFIEVYYCRDVNHVQRCFTS
ncbi:hypothetical protein KSF78_0007835 [Schistosoma japonicum]|nr:hypothetical protein KSF78_0007835 [Schistosoma japonicum]